MGVTIFVASVPPGADDLYSDEQVNALLINITNPEERQAKEMLLRGFGRLGHSMDNGLLPPSVPEIQVRGKLTPEG